MPNSRESNRSFSKEKGRARFSPSLRLTFNKRTKMLRPINAKDKSNFIYFCQFRDHYSDFYITKDDRRLYLTNIDNAKIAFNDCIKHGNKCFIKEENNEIKAVLLVVGFKDNILDLFSFLQWQDLDNLYMKVKTKNTNFVKYDERNKRYKPSYVLRKNGFSIFSIKDREAFLKKEKMKFKYSKVKYNKDKE